MKRDNWKFGYTVSEVLEGARSQLKYHSDRLQFWTKARDTVKDKIKDDGINITESVVEKLGASYNNSTANWNGPQVSIKAEYLAQIGECNTKINQRKASVAEYESWVYILDDAAKETPTRELKLSQADWLFFFNTK